jgi:serine/threonine-protein kinase
LGDYILFRAIASGGMGSVYLGRRARVASETVAIKTLHPHLRENAEFVSMLADEARLVRCVVHPNVVRMVEFVTAASEPFLVMEYVHGETVAALYRSPASGDRPFPEGRPPLAVAVAILLDTLAGLDAAHRAVGENGLALGLIHRDISPQNIIVGVDGRARILDFGVAKATGRIHQTREGVVKGKLPYMPPEMLRGGALTQSVDTYAAGVVLWELLTGQRLFQAENDAMVIGRVLEHVVKAPSTLDAAIPVAVDRVVMRAISRTPSQRYASARELAEALRGAYVPATEPEVARWLDLRAATRLRALSALTAEMAAEAEHTIHEPEPAYGASPEAGMRSQVAGDISGERPRRSRVLRAVAASSVLAALLGGGAYVATQRENAPLVLAHGERATPGATPRGITAAPGVVGPAPSLSAAPSAPKHGRAPTAQAAQGGGPAAARTASVPTSAAGTAKSAVHDPSYCYVPDSSGTMHIRPECL